MFKRTLEMFQELQGTSGLPHRLTGELGRRGGVCGFKDVSRCFRVFHEVAERFLMVSDTYQGILEWFPGLHHFKG